MILAFRRFALPQVSLHPVHWRPLASRIHVAEVILGSGISLFGGFAIQTERLGIVP